MKRSSLILGVLVALAPALSFAQQDRFRAIDRNGDRSITSEEWYAQRLAPVPFTVVDLNGDGRISESEYREWSSARGGASFVGITPSDRFRAIDKNKDNVLSIEEWKDGSLSLTPFAGVDANKDSRISLREFMAWDETRGGTAGAAPAPPGVAGAPAPSGVAGASGPAGIAGPPGVQPTQPPTPSSLTPSPPSAVTTTPGTSQIPGISSPSIGTATGNTTR